MDNEGSNAAKTRREGPAMRVPSPFQRPLKQKMAQVRKEGVTSVSRVEADRLPNQRESKPLSLLHLHFTPFAFQDSLELELGASATGVHKIPAPSGAPSAAPSNVLDPQAHARRLKRKSSSGSKDASGVYFVAYSGFPRLRYDNVMVHILLPCRQL